MTTEVKPTLNEMQCVIRHLSGWMGGDIANNALSNIINTYDIGREMPLSNEHNMQEMLADLDQAIVEMIHFRNKARLSFKVKDQIDNSFAPPWIMKELKKDIFRPNDN